MMRYKCMTCGMEFDTKPTQCPSCGQSNFGDRQDSEADPVAELSEEDEEDEEDEEPPPLALGLPADPLAPAPPRRRRKTSRTVRRKK